MTDRDCAIIVENISKCYRIGFKEDVADTIAGTLIGILQAPIANYRKYRSLYRFNNGTLDQNEADGKVIWALKNVSFGIKEGEIVGIIGVNGAGKSTLLKILSKITVPTSGRAKIRGKISSLLEVGTGFHPELTGRENVYLNGTILGMRKREIDGKFDEIVDFSGVERFIDTPVKRYSSGMRLRLAFAVAAQLQAEILLIDEVLAVGDAHFQKKCLDKMREVGEHGRTVLFVSHSMPAVIRLCPRTILLNGGKLLMDGPSAEVISDYLNSAAGTKAERTWPNLAKAPGDEVVRLCAVRVKTVEGIVSDVVNISQPIAIEMEYEVLRAGHVLSSRYHVFNENGVKVFISLDTDERWREQARSTGRYLSTAWIPGNLLSEGRFYITASMRTPVPSIRRFYVDTAVGIHVVDGMDGKGARGDVVQDLDGVVRPLLQWKTRMIQSSSTLNDRAAVSDVR